MRNINSEWLPYDSKLVSYTSTDYHKPTDPPQMLYPLHFIIPIVNKPFIKKWEMSWSPHDKIRLLENMIETAFKHETNGWRKIVPSINHIVLHKRLASLLHESVSLVGTLYTHHSRCMRQVVAWSEVTVAWPSLHNPESLSNSQSWTILEKRPEESERDVHSGG